jgi:hypothetical protein
VAFAAGIEGQIFMGFVADFVVFDMLDFQAVLEIVA